MLAAEKPFAQISQRKRKAKSSKCAARLNVYVLEDLFRLIVLLRQRSRFFCQEVCGELARNLSIFGLFPRPFFLGQLGMLAKPRFFLEPLTIIEIISNDDMKTVSVCRLSEFSVGKFFPSNVAQGSHAPSPPERSLLLQR